MSSLAYPLCCLPNFNIPLSSLLGKGMVDNYISLTCHPIRRIRTMFEMKVIPIRTRMFRQGDSLEDFIVEHLARPNEGGIIAVTSKIVALSQGRVVSLTGPMEKERWIRKGSSQTLKTPWCFLTKVNGEWVANAGVDESNADGSLILLPRNIQRTAASLITRLKKRYRLQRLGVIITDTRICPMRVGTMGVAVGYAGFAPIKNYVGMPDLFGRKLKRTQANNVNALAIAAVLVMGEGAERRPLAVIEGADVVFGGHAPSIASLTIDPRDDLYNAAYANRRRH